MQEGLQSDWPVPTSHILRFMLALADRKISPWSIATYLFAIAFVSSATGMAYNTGDFRVRKVLEGLWWRYPAAPDRHRPVTLAILKGLGKVFEYLCVSPHEALLFRTATLVFQGFSPWGAFGSFQGRLFE